MNLEQHIEAILFYKAEPVSKGTLARMCDVSASEISEAIARLHAHYEGRGIHLVETDTAVELATAPACSEFIQTLRKQELKKDIGKAGAETLAIILYRGPIARADIDSIRGVNSNFIIRNLLTRGLIERVSDTRGGRSVRYVGTPRLLEHLGISRKEELPQYAEIMDALDVYEREQRAGDAREQDFQKSHQSHSTT